MMVLTQGGAVMEHGFLINAFNYSSADDVQSVRKAIHEAVEIKCFYEGETTLLIGEEILQVRAGDVVVINPYEFHATIDSGIDTQRGRYHLFMIPLDCFANSKQTGFDLYALFFSEKRLFQNLFRGNTVLYELLNEIAVEYTNKESQWQCVTYSVMLKVFALLIRSGLKEDEKECLDKDMLHTHILIEPALRRIRDHYEASISSEELASICKLSRTYFCRVFKKAVGKSALEYLQEYRLTVSDALLRNTDQSITQIAEHCGFGSVHYFSRCYKSRYGISPSQRRDNRNKPQT